MSSIHKYFCDFCEKELTNSRDYQVVDIAHRPPEWKLRGQKAEDLRLCGKCYIEFLTIIRKRSSKGICGICRFAYCCTEKEDSNCEHVDEPPKRKWWKWK